jgi:Na+/H+-dicarboxylate symporter
MTKFLTYPLKFFKITLWKQILIALVLGIAFGFIFPEIAIALAPIGQLFINGIQLMVVPVVFVSVTCGVLSLRGTVSMGRITAKTITVYVVTMAIAGTIGILVSQVTQPGQGLDLSLLIEETYVHEIERPNIQTIIMNLIPGNMFETLSNNSMILQVVVIAVLLALAIMNAGESGHGIQKLFNNMFSVMMQFALLIMRFAPIGVFCLMGVMVSKFGLDMLIELFTMIATIYAGFLIHMVFVYSGILAFVSRLNPIRFYRGFFDAIVFAFSTASSAASLPIALRCSEKNLGVAKSIGEFVLPLGTSINMNGVALYLGVSAVFAANLYGIDLTVGQMILIVITSTVAAMGASGVPGSTLFVMPLVLSTIGVPFTVVAIIAAVDRIIDMMSTATNITGDALAAVVVAESEGMLDRDVYNQKNKPV